MATSTKNNLQVVKGYSIIEKLGVGSYGVVYKAKKKGDDRIFVLKQISLYNMNKEEIEDVKNESKILSSLNSPFITKYFDSFIDNNYVNIIMEYCDGGDLCHYLENYRKNNSRTMSEDRIWRYFIQMCLGLAYIHNKKILHRDLKSLNIFLTKEDKVKIGDLGVAKVLNNTDFANTFIGTPYYLSPEICEEKPYNEKSDVWAFGCILYEMATYKHPFNATNQGALILKILRGKYDPISSKDYSLDLRKMIDGLLEKSSYKRPYIKDIIKNPFFQSKAKSLNMLEMVLTSCSEMNITIEFGYIFKEIVLTKDVSSTNITSNSAASEFGGNKDKKASNLSGNGDKKKSGENFSNIKNIKLEFCEKKNEDPSKKFIQMNLPHNYKKQMQQKKEKKEILNKQNNQVKQVINSNSNNGNIYIALNNVNNNIYSNHPNTPASDRKDKRVPVKVIKREDNNVNFSKNNISDNSHNDINISYTNSNQNFNPKVQYQSHGQQGQQINLNFPMSNNELKEKDKYKFKVLNKKINEFEMNLNEFNKRNIVQDKKSCYIPSKKENENISNPKEFTNVNVILKNKNIQSTDGADRCESLENYEIYKMKKLINDHMKDNSDIRKVEKAQMFLPKQDEMKAKKLLYIDDKSSTGFLKNVIGRDSVYNEIINNKMDIHCFINQLDKKSSNMNLLKSSDINIMDDFISNNKNMVEINLQEKIQTEKDKEKEKAREKEKERDINKSFNTKVVPTNIKIKKKIVDDINILPLCDKDQDDDFKLCYNEEVSHTYTQKDNSVIKSTNNNTHFTTPHNNEDSFDEFNTNSDLDSNNHDRQSNKQENSEDEDDILAEEKVSVIKDLKINNDITNYTNEDNKKQLNDLYELKKKFTVKIDHHKEECIKSSGEEKFNKIIQYYYKSAESEELTEKLDIYIRQMITSPENYFKFIQYFYSFIYYEVQLVNVDKEIEERKLNI